MREADVPTHDTLDELSKYIQSLVGQKQDYGTCVYAMSMAAVAAFNYVARSLGVTGFQASCADLDVIRRTRRLKGPFMLIDADKMLYPQYNIEGDVRKALNEWLPWASEEARKLLYSNEAHPNIVRHWKHLATAAPAQEPTR